MMHSPNATSDSPTMSGGPPQHPASLGVTQSLRQDRVVLSVAVLCGILLGYQLVVTLLHPAWAEQATDWLLTVLAWLELALVAYVSLWLTRTRKPDALAWWLVCAALLTRAIARATWTVDDDLILPNDLPFPSFPDYL